MALAWIQTTGVMLAFFAPELLETSFSVSSLPLPKTHLLTCSVLNLSWSLPNPSPSVGFLHIISSHTIRISFTMFGTEWLFGARLPRHVDLHQWRHQAGALCRDLLTEWGKDVKNVTEGRAALTQLLLSMPSSFILTLHYPDGRGPWLLPAPDGLPWVTILTAASAACPCPSCVLSPLRGRKLHHAGRRLTCLLSRCIPE